MKFPSISNKKMTNNQDQMMKTCSRFISFKRQKLTSIQCHMSRNAGTFKISLGRRIYATTTKMFETRPCLEKTQNALCFATTTVQMYKPWWRTNLEHSSSNTFFEKKEQKQKQFLEWHLKLLNGPDNGHQYRVTTHTAWNSSRRQYWKKNGQGTYYSRSMELPIYNNCIQN